MKKWGKWAQLMLTLNWQKKEKNLDWQKSNFEITGVIRVLQAT